MRKAEKEKVELKFTLVGKQAVGKSALVMRFKSGIFEKDMSSTIGAHFASMEKPSRDGKTTIKVNLWDTAGMERFISLVPMYIRNASIVLICFDSSKISEIKEHIQMVRSVNEDCEIVFVKTKIDDPSLDTARVSEIQDLENYAKTEGYRLYKTSSKTGTGIDILFEECIEKAYASKRGNVRDENIVKVREQPEPDKSYITYCCNLM